jgi:lysosomal Pro-X carboxypeptidase
MDKKQQITVLCAVMFCSAVGAHAKLLYPTPFTLEEPGASSKPYHYSVQYFKQTLDHYNFAETRTFQQRYLISKDHWQAPSAGKAAGPIFFYTGNEGDITLFAANTGFLWETAVEFNAMVVFAEHRYYGVSLPFGNATYGDVSNLAWMTSEQALSDYAVLLTYLKGSIAGAANTKVISFGGSYGGMLSAWIRQKFPNIVDGAIAASAPVLQFTGVTGPEVFNTVLTNDFSQAGPDCVPAIRASWGVMSQVCWVLGVGCLGGTWRGRPGSRY